MRGVVVRTKGSPAETVLCLPAKASTADSREYRYDQPGFLVTTKPTQSGGWRQKPVSKP